jgi:hypothetical protein
MTDEELIEHIRSIKPIAIKMVNQMPDEVLTITDPLIIEAAWGPRRVSSRTRGMKLEAYPKEVSAHKSLWQHWLNQDRPFVAVVIAKKRAQARINAALGVNSQDPEEQTQDPETKLSQEEIDDLMQEREELRASRKFSDADKIRDYLTANGVEVADQKIKPPP